MPHVRTVSLSMRPIVCGVPIKRARIRNARIARGESRTNGDTHGSITQSIRVAHRVAVDDEHALARQALLLAAQMHGGVVVRALLRHEAKSNHSQVAVSAVAVRMESARTIMRRNASPHIHDETTSNKKERPRATTAAPRSRQQFSRQEWAQFSIEGLVERTWARIVKWNVLPSPGLDSTHIVPLQKRFGEKASRGEAACLEKVEAGERFEPAAGAREIERRKAEQTARTPTGRQDGSNGRAEAMHAHPSISDRFLEMARPRPVPPYLQSTTAIRLRFSFKVG